jgi:hypothetical protein
MPDLGFLEICFNPTFASQGKAVMALIDSDSYRTLRKIEIGDEAAIASPLPTPKPRWRRDRPNIRCCAIKNNQFVRKGDVLFIIDQERRLKLAPGYTITVENLDTARRQSGNSGRQLPAGNGFAGHRRP